MQTVKLAAVSKAILKQWQDQQVVRHADNYSLDSAEKAVLIPEDAWEHVVRDTEFGAYNLITFERDGEEFTFPMRNNQEPKEGLQMYAKKYVAVEGFTSGNGTVVKPGTVKWFMSVG
jgi:hypothetical protein